MSRGPLAPNPSIKAVGNLKWPSPITAWLPATEQFVPPEPPRLRLIAGCPPSFLPVLSLSCVPHPFRVFCPPRRRWETTNPNHPASVGVPQGSCRSMHPGTCATRHVSWVCYLDHGALPPPSGEPHGALDAFKRLRRPRMPTLEFFVQVVVFLDVRGNNE